MQRLVENYARDGMVVAVALKDEPERPILGTTRSRGVAETPTRFVIKVVEATFDFPPGEAPPASMPLRQDGQDAEFKRQSE